ncbi:hypothetical protein Gbth_005_215 [Gluconobacter thailandicus F149-1 = NBRC 100600]|uniref:YfdX family protein n=1 Tax=Gluconobacter thailandicus NBRC 3257 TaxID=1381097 RepID=A0ABQ0ITL4_GLUTH|nr:YfdX family protein [Gluconobacter thailandicus]KXV52221.1 hypothetical protein AD946_12755 [Gluconobacter thailandicus]GAC87487.1 hypothetical protein NBRC3255_1148 [Gluconobacter thailandicus NBRC 3255]GAD25553.1 hypothetical protein NBRC3257_0552 [Gluconobacter thailandicus NBRC 3257]GAN92214.1 hypothetical protein Gbth_005_215 [Gluconobacter thailandicus F149-1 = NBRC 100600]GBR60698.1 hypothetical protein AA100600_2230 [Gluconobacter thailandicus F149-1 = NBRC 100600]
MKIFFSLLASAVLTLSTVPAHASSLHKDWESFKAHRAFHHLSSDGQHTMTDILKARQILAAGQTDAAIPALYDAQKRLVAATKATQKFQAAESELHTAPGHPLPPEHHAATGQLDWLPVGGEFIASETLAPEQKAAIASANTQLKNGDTDAASQTMKVVGQNADFILALAPISPLQGTINRATVFTEGRHPKEAMEALDEALNSIVFVSEDFVTSIVPDKTSSTNK